MEFKVMFKYKSSGADVLLMTSCSGNELSGAVDMCITEVKRTSDISSADRKSIAAPKGGKK